MNNQSGLCECGCGQKTNLAVRTETRHGWVKGQPLRFLTGHNNYKREQSRFWKGGRKKLLGYIAVHMPEHPRSHCNGYVLEHILLAEKALGKSLPLKTEVHHFNESRADNSRGNLVICEDHEYHILLHTRRKALQACGNPNWRKCSLCKQWDDPKNLVCYRYKGKVADTFHRDCYNRQKREYIQRKKHYASAA